MSKTLLQRLSAIQDEVSYIQKEKKQGMRYSIVSHDAVTAKVRPLMVKHGVLYYPKHMGMQQAGNRTELQMSVCFVNVDDSSDFIEVATAGYGIDDQDKGPGKAISYAVKYALLKTLGLETGDDPDIDQDVRHNPEPRDYNRDPVPLPDGSPYQKNKGYNPDGTKTSHLLNKEGSWKEIDDQLTEDLADCHSLVSLEGIKAIYRKKAADAKWNGVFLKTLKERFDQAEEAIMASMDAKEEDEMDDLLASQPSHPTQAGYREASNGR